MSHYFASMHIRGKQQRRRSSFEPERLPPLNLCDGCRREHFTTVNCICLGCAQGVLHLRRALFSRSEGNVFMSRRFGRAFRNNFKNAQAGGGPKLPQAATGLSFRRGAATQHAAD